MHSITYRIDTIVVGFVTSVAEQQDRIGRIGHVVEHCIEREIAEWVQQKGSIQNPSPHRSTFRFRLDSEKRKDK